MATKSRSLVFSLVLALLLVGGALALLSLGVYQPPPVLAQGPDGYDIYYVSLDGNCAGETPCYTTVQEAVDAVDDPADEIRVATGTYTGVNGYGGLSQMVYISKSLTLRGGYSTTFTLQDPALYTTTLNAQDNGRVLYINGSDITVTVEGLDIWGGYVSGAGGGIYIAQATATITDCFIRWNGYDDWEVYNSKGGGVYVNNGANIRLENNTFYRNWAHYGGGIYIENTSDAMLVRNELDDNRARHDPGRGGGIYAQYSPGITLIDNDIHDNQALPDDFSEGGGVYIRYSDHAVLQDNRFYDNYVQIDQPGDITSLGGGGIYVSDSDHVLVTGNDIYNNTVHGEQSRGWPYGGGALIESSAYLTFTHNLVHHNTANGVTNSHGDGGGLALEDMTDSFVAHNEIYANTATDRWGGVVLYGDRFTFIDNQVYDNEAQDGNAGGIYLGGGDHSTLRNNEIHHNTVSGTSLDYYGGGLYISGSNNNTLEGNRIYANTSAYAGGGLQISGSGHTLIANRIFSNTASYGGGLRVSADDTTLINNVLAYNEATGVASGNDGSGAAFRGGNTRWYHTTVVGNIGDGSGLYAFSNCTATFTNTLVYSQTTGVRNNASAVTMTLTLWDDVPTQTIGGVSTFGDITGTAALAADGYHLTASSDAIGEGISTDVDTDVDGQPRSMGNAPDLGADEYAYYADLALKKQAEVLGSVGAGEIITYTLTVTNAASSEVDADARVVDAVEPASGVAALRADAPGDTCIASGTVVTCTVSNLLTDTVRTVTVWVTPTATYDGVLTNTATVTPTNAVDSNGADNADAVTTTVTYVPPVPDLWVEKDAPAFVEPDAPLRYDLSWGNAGAVTATSVTMTDTLPGGVSFVTSTLEPASTDPLVWRLGDLAPGETATATVRAVVGALDDGTALVNHVAISGTATEDVIVNNTDAATTTVYALGGYDLWLEKESDPAEVEVGDTIGYALWVTNTGELPADVTLLDAIPAGTEYVAGSASALGGTGTLNDSDGIEWMGALEVGEDVLVTFGVKVVACEGVDCGAIRNVATAEIDGVSYLWQEQADTVVRCPDLTISGEGPERSPQFSDGTFKRYDVTFTYENKNEHDAPGVAHTSTVTITLPEGAQFSASNPIADETAPDKRTKVWHLGDLAAGASNTITVQVEPYQWLDDGVPVTATIASDPGVECDPNAPNQETVTTHLTKMALEKKAQPPKTRYVRDPKTNLTELLVELEYALRYLYQTTDPNRPPVTSYRIDDRWPGELDFERHSSEPKLEMEIIGAQGALAADPPTTLRFEGTEYLRVGDQGWLRLKGSTSVVTPGHVIVNEAEETYETQKTEGTGTEIYTDSARVESEIPLVTPYIMFPEEGKTCAGDSLQVAGAAQGGVTVTIYMDDDLEPSTQVAQVKPDEGGYFTATVDFPATSEFTAYYIIARADRDGEVSGDSNRVTVGTPSAGGWCPQRSYWEGTLKAGPNQGQHRTYVFRGETSGMRSTRNWKIAGEYGFWDTDLHLYSCCAEQTQAMTVTADGEVYTPSSRDGHWYHFDITGGAHDVTIQSQCGDEKSESSGEILIDPDGYVFNVDEGGRYDPTMGGSFNPVEPISGVTVTCMMSAPQWGGWVPWPAHLYEDQVNPQVTDDAYPDGITTTGYYAFFTPPGHYYIQVEGIDGYQAWRSPVVEVITQIVHVNVPYTPWISDTGVSSVTVMPAPVDIGDGTLWAGVHLDPTVITVPVGSVVEWTSTLSETNTVDDLIRWSENPIFQVLSERDPLQDTRGFDSGYLAPGRVYRRAFAYPGVYTYTVLGRSGRVIVTGKQPTIYLPLVLRE